MFLRIPVVGVGVYGVRVCVGLGCFLPRGGEGLLMDRLQAPRATPVIPAVPGIKDRVRRYGRLTRGRRPRAVIDLRLGVALVVDAICCGAKIP